MADVGVPLPTRKEDVSVQIVISNDPLRLRAPPQLLQAVYPVPMTPFLLGVPPGNVRLFLWENNRNFPDDAWVGVKSALSVCFEGRVDFFPSDYHEYFLAVYHNAKAIDSIFVLPPPHLRIFSGHAVGTFGGGYFAQGREEISFSRFQGNVAGLLTVLDACNAAHAIGSMTATFPHNNPGSFNNRKKRSLLKSASIPILCEANNFMYAFSVGYRGQHNDPEANGGLKNMTLPFGHSALCSLLVAAKQYVENNMKGSMDAFYKKAYESISVSLLENPDYTPSAISQLRHIEDLISNGALVVDVHRMDDCELFSRKQEWFLTSNRVTALTKGQENVAQQLISYIIQSVVEWHKGNPDSLMVLPESTKAFGEIIEALGPFGNSLKMVCLDWDEETKTLVESADGVEFESWAVSCGILLTCLYKVKHVLRTGEFDYPGSFVL